MGRLSAFVLASLVLLQQPGYAFSPTYAPPPGIKIVEQGDGLLIVDTKGIALYTNSGDADVPGKSVCNQQCVQQWPPLSAAADAKPQGAWSTVAREDGSLQWAVDGRPLYYYSAEGGPGTSFGDGESGNTWRVAVVPIWTPPGVTIKSATLGTVLADVEGLTFYTRERDTPNKSSCSASCLQNFVPVAAPALALANGDWSVVTRDDSSKQWAYKGKPLYRSLMDVKPDQINGVDQVWRAAVLQAAAPLPSWVTLQQSLGGEVLADSHGLTLYYRGASRLRAAFGSAGPCVTATCMGSDWNAVLAEDGAQPTGNWTIVANQDGTQQWAYKGKRIYTSRFDNVPGELRGRRHGGDRAWRIMTRSEDCPDLC